MAGNGKMDVVLGIDVGTSGTKTVAVSANGAVLGSATVGYEMHVPQAGWAEQNPEDWWRATHESVRQVMEGLAGNGMSVNVAGISFSGQMHGLVPLDAQGNVVRPSIIWCDVRTGSQAETLERNIGRETIIGWTENPPLPNFTVTKLLWMREHEPDLYAKIATVQLPKDYVRYRMTGRLAMEVTDASGTLMLDVAHRRWSEELCKAAGIPLEWLPELHEATDIVGQVTGYAAALMGVPEGTPVVAGAADQAAGAIGLGIIRPGVVSAVFGTSGVVLTAMDHPVRDPAGRLHTFCHTAQDRWYTMGVTQAAGGSLQWYGRRLADAERSVASQMGVDPYTLMMQEAAQAPAGSEGLVFLPYLMGERTPHLNPDARGAWLGLTWRHERQHLVRSVLEGVSFSLRDCWEIIAGLGAKADAWRVSGGGAQGRVWMEIFASVLGSAVETIGGAHGPAYGAAILAAQGVGILGKNAEAVSAWIPAGDVVQPNSKWIETYERLYPIFRSGYTATKALGEQLARM